MYDTAWQERDVLASWRAQGVSLRTVPPAVSPVSLELLKAQSVIKITEDDLLAVHYLESATAWVERYTGRALIEQTWTLTLDAPPAYRAMGAILLPRVPVLSVTSVKSYSPTDVETAMSAVTDYAVDIASEPGRIVLRDGIAWPSGLRNHNGLVVTYKAGYGESGESVPIDIRQAICLLAAHWYENREASINTDLTEIPFGVQSLVDSYRTGV